jgi:hypothetical protein
MTRVVCDSGQPRRMETCGAEEPDEGNLHVRFCGGIGRVIADPTRTADCLQRPLLRRSRFRQRLSASVRLLQIRGVLSLLGRGPCAHLTWTFSYSILGLHGLSVSSGWSAAGCLGVNKCTVFCRNISRNIQRYWISRRLCRSISCSASHTLLVYCP